MSVRISVVTPSFNQVAFLEQTLRSVLAQREHIHEYFVLDGGSADGSADVIRSYAPKGIDWWVSEKDGGQSDAIAKGFARATGDILCWLNSDDLFLPCAMSRVQRAFDANPAWEVATGYHVRINEDSKTTAMICTGAESFAQARQGVMRVCQQSCFFRRDLYRRAGALRLDLHCVMDTELWYRFMRAGAVWGHVPHFLSAYRWHSEAKMLGTKWAERAKDERCALVDEYPEFRPTGWRGTAGLAKYRAKVLFDGSFLRSRLLTKRYRGQPVQDLPVESL